MPRFQGTPVEDEEPRKLKPWELDWSTGEGRPPRDLLAGKKPRWGTPETRVEGNERWRQAPLVTDDPAYSKGRTARIDGNVVRVPDDYDPKDVALGRVANGRWFRDTNLDGYMPSASEILHGAATNAIPDAVQIASDTWNAVTHPVQTASNIAELGKSALAATGAIEGDPTQAEAVWQSVKDNYGGLDNIARRIRDKPLSAAMDASTVLTGGGSLAARAPGALGKIGRGAVAAGDIIDPMAVPGRVVGKALNTAGNVAATGLGVSTGVGGDTLRTMNKAGREGNTMARDAMRGDLTEQAALDMADNALSTIQQARSDTYKADMAATKASAAQVDFVPIVQKFSQLKDVYLYKGKVTNIEAERTARIAKKQVTDFYASGPDYRTVGAADALRQSLNDLRATTEPGSKSRLVIDGVLQTMKGEIEKASPGYAKALDNYAESSRQISEIRKTLSMGPSATRDQTLRKLQSTQRNNANTNYGARVRLLDQLAAHEPNLPGVLAGMSLNSLEPRSLARVGTPLAHALAGGLAGGLPGAFLSTAVGMAASSPRIAGEAAYATGRMARAADSLTPAQRRILRQTLFRTGQVNAAVESQRGPWLKYRTK